MQALSEKWLFVFHAVEIHDVLSPTIFSNKDGAVSPILV